jgi:acyl carrier protein
MNIDTALGNKLIAYIATYCAVSPETVTRETMTSDIGLDSLSLTQIIAALESEFSFELQEADLTGLLEAASIGNYFDLLNEAAARVRAE